jgi:hypothetical protein
MHVFRKDTARASPLIIRFRNNSPILINVPEPLPIVKTKKWGVFGAFSEKPALDLEESVA